jgi:hypothetical protein
MKLIRFLTAALFAVLLTAIAASTSSAQTATPQATPGGPSAGYPVAIHNGTCNNITAEPAWKLDDATGVGISDNGKTPDTLGTAQGAPVLESSTKIDVKLDDLGSGPHVVAVHASAEKYNDIIACGTIGGVKDNGKVVIPLVPVNGSTVVGIAILDEDNSGVLGLGKDQTQVTVYLFDQASVPGGTPAAQ